MTELERRAWAVRARRRTFAAIVRAPLEPRHYRALFNIVRLFHQPWRILLRYLIGRGTHPFVCRIRTPIGRVRVTTYTPDDLVTVVEVFARLDYEAPDDVRLVVDVGANIGVSTLYFLTRNQTARCYAFEPVPRNVERFRRTLSGFEDRFTLRAEAVALEDSDVEFGVEATGRYGGIGVEAGQKITVRARNINDVLAEIVAADGGIDVLKIDIEGLELRTVQAIRRDLLRRIRLIYFESSEPADEVHDDLFDRSRRGQCERLVRRPTAAGELQ